MTLSTVIPCPTKSIGTGVPDGTGIPCHFSSFSLPRTGLRPVRSGIFSVLGPSLPSYSIFSLGRSGPVLDRFTTLPNNVHIHFFSYCNHPSSSFDHVFKIHLLNMLNLHHVSKHSCLIQQFHLTQFIQNHS